jgi:hypothetical protein
LVTLVNNEDSRASITTQVPSSDVVSNSTDFSAEQLPQTSATSLGLPTGSQLVGDYFYQLSAANETTNNPVHTFTTPLTITIAYNPTTTQNLNNLQVGRYDTGTGWTLLSGCTTNTTANTIACPTSNFSYFALLADTSTTSPTPTVIPSSTPYSAGGTLPNTNGTSLAELALYLLLNLGIMGLAVYHITKYQKEQRTNSITLN